MITVCLADRVASTPILSDGLRPAYARPAGPGMQVTCPIGQTKTPPVPVARGGVG